MMTDTMHVYALLNDACRQLDQSNDHAVAAHVGLAISLLEQKYGIQPNEFEADDSAESGGSDSMPPPPEIMQNGGSWA